MMTTASTPMRDVAECVETHATYLLNWAFGGDGTGYTGEERARADQVGRDMGYAFSLTQASLSLGGLDADGVDGTVSVEARGDRRPSYTLTPTLVDQATGVTIGTADPIPTLLPAIV